MCGCVNAFVHIHCVQWCLTCARVLEIVALRADAAQQTLYGSLDEYTAPTQLENYTTERGFGTHASRTVTIDSPPAVLTIQIQRASYDKATQQYAKLNASFSFPKLLSLDRYMEANRADTLRRRQRVREIEAHLQRLDAQLHALRFREGDAAAAAAAIPFDTHLAAVVAHFDARHRAAPSVGEKYELNVVLSRLRNELSSMKAHIRGRRRHSPVCAYLCMRISCISS